MNFLTTTLRKLSQSFSTSEPACQYDSRRNKLVRKYPEATDDNVLHYQGDPTGFQSAHSTQNGIRQNCDMKLERQNSIFF